MQAHLLEGEGVEREGWRKPLTHGKAIDSARYEVAASIKLPMRKIKREKICSRRLEDARKKEWCRNIGPRETGFLSLRSLIAFLFSSWQFLFF